MNDLEAWPTDFRLYQETDENSVTNRVFCFVASFRLVSKLPDYL